MVLNEVERWVAQMGGNSDMKKVFSKVVKTVGKTESYVVEPTAVVMAVWWVWKMVFEMAADWVLMKAMQLVGMTVVHWAVS